MSFYVSAPPPGQRSKLGLALAGGGFRASLFHLGVLRRMAELDLLRYVETLSTVSGGSIVAALYVLMLKEKLDHNARLSQIDYLALVENLENTFVTGIQKDLRTHLLMNPIGMLGVLLSHQSLSKRMGRIYERYIYRNTVDKLRAQDAKLPRGNWISRCLWPGQISLPTVRFKPGGEEVKGGIEAYNAKVLDEKGKGSAITNFIMNCTALNSAAPFRFSSNEIGDPRLGYFRYDEIKYLDPRKELLEQTPEGLDAMLNGTAPVPTAEGRPLDLKVVALARWWPTREACQPKLPSQLGYWSQLFGNPDLTNVLTALRRTNFGRLRQLKLSAWYVQIGSRKNITGGLSVQEHLARFNQVLGEIEPTVSDPVTTAITNQSPLGLELLDFAIELYYLRSAEAMSSRLRDDFDAISLGTAVAASANFPPVFPPLVLLGIYDDLHVTRLGLSDGGVYDNMGITTLLDEGCTHIIASDTGSPFDVKQRVSSRYLGMIGRLPDVLMDDVAEQQRTQLRERRRVSRAVANCEGDNPRMQELKTAYKLDGLAFFSIDSLDPADGGGGIDLGFNPLAAACLRTDLDCFGDLEVAALINTGYDRADRFLKAYFGDSPYAKETNNSCWKSPAVAPRPIPEKYKTYLPHVLTVGQSRLFRSLQLRSFWSIPSWLFLIAIVIAALYFLDDRRVSIAALVNKLPDQIIIQLEKPLPWFPNLFVNRWARSLVRRSLSSRLVLVGVILILVLAFIVWPWLASRFRQTRTAKKRKFVTAMKWIRAFAPAVFLFVGLTPIWVAVAAWIIASAIYIFYDKPFLQATRMR